MTGRDPSQVSDSDWRQALDLSHAEQGLRAQGKHAEADEARRLWKQLVGDDLAEPVDLVACAADHHCTIACALAANMRRRIEARRATVCVVGQGYVGLPLALRATEVGFSTMGLDTDGERVIALARRTSYVDGVDDADIAEAHAAGYRATTGLGPREAFDIWVVTVPTPLRDGQPDTSYITAAAETISERLLPGNLVVLESTTYPGTTDELFRPLLEDGTGLVAGVDFFLAYSPERIDPGNPGHDLVTTPKLVAGCDPASASVAVAFYSAMVDRVVPVATCAEAELAKLLENTFRTVNVALVNELAILAGELGIDIWGAIDAAATKPFGFMRFTPGPGVGGHCLPIDPSYLSWRVRQRLGHSLRFVELANDVNQAMPAYVVARAAAMLNDAGKAIRDSHILALGLAYKANTADWRGSPAVTVVDRLNAMGATVIAIEPHCGGPGGAGAMLSASGERHPTWFPDVGNDDLAEADLVILLVDHDEFDLDAIATFGRLVLDTRGALRPRPFCGETL